MPGYCTVSPLELVVTLMMWHLFGLSFPCFPPHYRCEDPANPKRLWVFAKCASFFSLTQLEKLALGLALPHFTKYYLATSTSSFFLGESVLISAAADQASVPVIRIKWHREKPVFFSTILTSSFIRAKWHHLIPFLTSCFAAMPNRAKESPVTASQGCRGLQPSSSDTLHTEYILLGYDGNRLTDTTAQTSWLCQNLMLACRTSLSSPYISNVSARDKIDYRLFHSEGTYNDDLVQLPDHFQADQVKTRC